MKSYIGSMSAVSAGFFALIASTSHAQDTEPHILNLKTPDHFQVRTVEVSQSESISDTARSVQSTTGTYISRYDQLRDGYRINRTLVDLDLSGLNIPASVPKDQATRFEQYTKAQAAITLDYRTDTKLTFAAFNNLDKVTAELKSATLAFMGVSDKDGGMMMGLEGRAATLLPIQKLQPSALYGKTLIVNRPVPMSNSTFDLFGTTLNMPGSATLTAWDEVKKTAHVTVVFAPAETEVREALVRMVKAWEAKSGSQSIPGGSADNLIKNTTISIKETCEFDIGIETGLPAQALCDVTSVTDFDIHSATVPPKHTQISKRQSMSAVLVP